MLQQRRAEAPRSILATAIDIALSRRTTSAASGRLRSPEWVQVLGRCDRVVKDMKSCSSRTEAMAASCKLLSIGTKTLNAPASAIDGTLVDSRFLADRIIPQGKQRRASRPSTTACADSSSPYASHNEPDLCSAPVGVVGPALHDKGAQLRRPPGGYRPSVPMRHLRGHTACRFRISNFKFRTVCETVPSVLHVRSMQGSGGFTHIRIIINQMSLQLLLIVT